MIQELHHIAIIASDDKSIDFYLALGFQETKRIERRYDTIVMLDGPCVLELYIDPTHPKRPDRPEALGLRHLAFRVENFDEIVNAFECEPIRGEAGKRYTFIKDPDGLPIELCE